MHLSPALLNPSSVSLLVLAFTVSLMVDTPSIAKEEIADVISPLIQRHEGEVSVTIKHLESGETYAYRENEPMPTASLIKFPIMIAAYQAMEDGQLSASQMLSLKKDDKVPGSGILTANFSEGTKLSLTDAIHLMMVFSDNTATNLVIDQLGLPATAEQMKVLKCPNTVLHSKVFRGDTSIFPERSKKFGLGSTSSAEMITLLELLQKEELVSQSASKKMIAHMAAVGGSIKIPRLLPAGTKVIHKSGSVSASRTDAGIILSPAGPIAVCVLTHKNRDRSWSDDNAGDMLCSTIAKAAYDYFNPEPSSDADKGPAILKVGSSGLLVEALQRTLNDRLTPSPDLGVDGEFGPMTEGAVKTFQKFKSLPETGQVGQETWIALGTLVEEQKVPSPEMINSEVVKKGAADDLSGPPFVTCKAWAIGDANTGKLLWGSSENQKRRIASTTKIMTGYLVTSLAEKDSKILDEPVVFSKRADNTPGSSARVRAGETIAAGDLIYGLLLPSGNDASVALAEHFGSRLGNGSTETSSYDLFIGAMNRKATELGMSNSSFKNPNGLPQEGHEGTAADLLKLGYHAMQQPLFRKYVSTFRRGCTVTGAEGYQRNLVWQNTNRLLRTEGFVGVKTGTTSAAGACLVSQENRGEKSLMVIVLGSSSSDARYTDTRNLYRWAWQELGFEAK